MRSEKHEFSHTYEKFHLLGAWQNELRATWERADLMDRDNDNWRSLWTLEMISRIAVHQSGVTARVARSPDDPRKDRISLENTANVDLSRWDLDELADEVMALWLEGNFEVLEGCITRCAGNPLFTQVTPHNLTRKRFASSYIR